MYITIEIIFLIFLTSFFIFIFVVMFFFVQLCIILVRNGMFYEQHKSLYLVAIFYYVIDTVYIYSRKNIDKILTHFGDTLFKK